MVSKFQTVVKIPVFNGTAGYQQRSLFMGSCFTENVGSKMTALKFPVDINPFGILYNPISIIHGLWFLLQKKRFTENDLIRNGGLWHSFFHHSRFSSPDASQTLENINKRIETSADFLRKAKFLFLTFGTARVYEYKTTGQTVSNCHKIPEKEFRRFRLTPGQIVKEFSRLLPEIWKTNPGLIVILTVSPIRHWKDGAIENQRSKATLLLAVDELVRLFGEKRCNYFPAYEIVMDELRDYRFYEEDMIHLSSAAINHIWDIFQNALVDEDSRKIADEIQKITAAINHKPFNKFTIEHLNFLKQSLQKVQNLQEKIPYLDMKFERNYFSTQIAETEKNIKNFQFKL